MTEEEWLVSDDPLAMLEALRTNWHAEEAGLVKLTHRYLLASCRAIWPLLPMEESRQGVEVAERYIEGRATRDEYAAAEYQAEGAAFFLDPYLGPFADESLGDSVWLREAKDQMRREREAWPPEVRESERRYETDRKARIESLVKDIEAIPVEEIHRMVRANGSADHRSPRQLLANAAYFADFAMVYPGVRPREGAIEQHSHFLSATLLREFVGTPYRGNWQMHRYNRRSG